MAFADSNSMSVINNIMDIAELLDIPNGTKLYLMISNFDKAQFIFSFGNNRIDLWKTWITKKDNYDMDCFAFSVNGKRSKKGIGLDENDNIVLIISDKENKNFFTIDLPKGWDKKDRKGEKYVMYKVNNDDDIIDTIDTISFDELLRYYNCDNSNNANNVDDENFHIEITI